MKASLIALFLVNKISLRLTLKSSTQSINTSSLNMSPDDILSLDAYSLSKRMERGEINARELMKATLDRIHSVNSSHRAIINLLPTDILSEQAKQADKTPRQGWLHGIPIAIKDLSNAAGLPTTLGGSPLVDHDKVAPTSDDFCRRLQDAGAIVIGKTNTPEHGLGSHSFNIKWGTTTNPYCFSKSAGGSSGGAAVAVATRILCVADGSDMMGSLRNPAGWNNIYSLRPTAGLLGDEGNPYLPFPISTVGPMARTPRDLAFLLETMCPKNAFGASTVHDISMDGMKIAWLGDWSGAYPMEPGILPLCRQALDEFQKHTDVTVVDIHEPLFDAFKLWDSWTTIRSKTLSFEATAEYGTAAFFGPSPRVKKEFVWEVKRGFKLSDAQVDEASVIAQEWSKCVQKVLATYDALALPSAQVWPYDATMDWPKSIGATPMNTYHRWMEIVIPATLAGLPVVTIPAGFGTDGLPMGIQLIGARGSDAKLLRLSQAYHEVIDWPAERPPSCVLDNDTSS